ncbi:MAG: sensor histidine kinase [Nitrospirae bacterium]|nr:sensor histidine kinase [Nitrospirota bacterium]
MVLFAVQVVAVGIAIRNLAENRIANRLGHDAEGLLLATLLLPDGIALDPERVDPIFDRPFSGHYYEVQVRDAVLRSRSLWDQELNVDLGRRAGQGVHTVGPQFQPLLVVIRHFRKGGEDIRIAVAEDLAPLLNEVRATQWAYALLSLGGLVLLVVAQRLLVSKALQPLDGVRRDIAALERGEVAALRETVPNEVRPLVAEFNRLLDLMAGRVSRSRNALGNLAHALKTPLTLLTQAADAPELAPHPALRGRLADETEKIRQLIERELKRARLAGVARPGQRLDLGAELKGLAAALGAVYRDKALDIRVELPAGTLFAADREDVLELFGNLMDNACKWARSRVLVNLEPGDGLVVAVADDGPGARSEDLEMLTGRGTRADEAIPGHGLGLAIASEVAESYGGVLTLSRSVALGGFLARVALPPAAPWAAGN